MVECIYLIYSSLKISCKEKSNYNYKPKYDCIYYGILDSLYV